MTDMTYDCATTVPPLPAAGAASGKPWGVWTTIAWCGVASVAPLVVARALAGNLYLGQHLTILLGWAVQLVPLVVAVTVRRAAVARYLAWNVPRPAGVILAGAALLAWEMSWSGFWYLRSGGASIGFGTSVFYRHYLAAGGSPFGFLYMWYPAIIYAPIVEETIFRGFLWRGLAASRLGNCGAWLLTSALFVARHIDGHRNLAQLICIGVCGLIFGLVRWRTGSTTASMITHSLSNLWVTGGTVVAVALGWPCTSQ
jgi:membrane protease YdiL (CAAX protease family)